MQGKSVSDALRSPLHEVVENGTKTVIKTMPEDLWFGLRNVSPAALHVKDSAEYEDLMASMLNFALKPSPASINDSDSAAMQAQDPGVGRIILNLLKTTSTHVMKAVNSKLSALTIIDVTTPVAPSEAYGLCHDTADDGVAFNIGGNAADSSLIPFWMCRFINMEGMLTSNLQVLMGSDPSQQALFDQTMIKLGGAALLEEIKAVVAVLKSKPMPDEVQGKIVLFPLGASAIKGDQYLAITPVPSAAMILRFKDRYFSEIAAQKAHNAEAKKNKQITAPRQFNYPQNIDIKVVASNPANCGSTLLAISGAAKAFKAVVGSLSIEDRIGQDGFIVRKLQSGRGSLLSINNLTLDYLSRTFQFGKVEQHWKGRLPDVLGNVIEPLQNLRQKGLPGGIAPAEARFKFPVERRFVLHRMEGDIGERNLTSTDLHEIAQHATNLLQQAMVRRDKGLGMTMDRQALVYQTIVDLVR